MKDIKSFFFDKRIFLFVVFLVILLVFLQGTNQGPVFKMQNSGFSMIDAPEFYGREEGGVAYDSYSMGKTLVAQNPIPASTASISVDQRKIVKNATLSLIVRNLDSAVASIKATAADLGGFVENLTLSEDGVIIFHQNIKEDRTRSGYVTLRVPTDKLETAIDRIKGEAIKVSSENITNQDVTEQFIDLEAQLRNLKREEQSYLDIFDRATKIEDILNISSRLSEVRGRIEGLEGQINYLSRTIDMSTISIALTSEADVEVFGIVWSPIAVIKEAIQNMLESLVGYVNALIRLVFSLPILILWLATIAGILFLLFKLFEFLKKMMFNR